MNLLNSGQNLDLQKRILDVLGQVGLSTEEMETARQFFDFSKEMDVSLLEKLSYRVLNYHTVHHNSCKLFEEMLRMPKHTTMEATDRLILFLDALTDNSIGPFLFNHSYMYTNQEVNIRLHHAYERRYPTEELQPKMLAFDAFAIHTENVFFTTKMLVASKKEPRDLYKAGKYYCRDNEKNTRQKLYAFALAYHGEDAFSKDERDEMTADILEKEKTMSSHYTNELENMVLLLFLSMNHSEEIKHRFRLRMKMNFELLLKALIEGIPASYFKENRDILSACGETALAMTVEKMIMRTIQSAVASDAFQHPTSWEKTKNSLSFLEHLAQKYPEQYISCMTSKEPLGLGAKWGYLFDHYKELYEILERAVPDVKEKYGLDTQNDLIQNAIHREVLDVKNTIRRQVVDYLKGDADLRILESIRQELSEGHKEWSTVAHEVNMLKQLRSCGDFGNKYIAFKIMQHPDSVEQYLTGFFQNGEIEKASAEMKNVFQAAIHENVPIEDRIKLFELLYSRNSYWEYRTKPIADTAVEIMAENAEQFEDVYEKECSKYDVVIRCCYAKYLEKTNTGNKNKDRLMALFSDASKEVRRTVTEIIGTHREYEPEMIAMLSAKKQAVRENAVDIIALWGAESYREMLEKAVEKEKSAKLADKIRAILTTKLSSGDKEGKAFSPITFVEDIHKGGRARKIAWLFEVPVPEVHFKNGTLADEKYMQAVILCYSTMDSPGRNESALLLADELDEDELNRYSAEIFSRWYSAGAESKTKWAMYFSVIHGGDSMVEIALKCIKEWAENMRGAIAAETVKAIALNGSSLALMTVDNLAHKFKQKQVRNAAAEAMEKAADALGITADELGDRIVPVLGFDDNMERIFDYGERKFRVCLSSTLALEVYDETGKKLKTMPAPGKKDDEALAKQSNAAYKSLKKQLKTVIAIQSVRLETALMSGRKWKKNAWESLFVKNPVMHSFAEGLIWTADFDNETVTFRYMEDGTFNTVDEDEFELPESCRIGLAHPIDLDDKTLSAWKEQLSDYEVIQPIKQLERPVYRVKEDEKGLLDLERFSGKSINALTLLGRATKLGWNKGSAQDAGLFYVFYREDITEKVKLPDGGFGLLGTAAELHFSGCYIAVENEDVTLENVRFYTPGTVKHGSYIYDEADNEKAIPLEKVPPRYFSEIVLQLEEITKSSEKESSGGSLNP